MRLARIPASLILLLALLACASDRPTSPLATPSQPPPTAVPQPGNHAQVELPEHAAGAVSLVDPTTSLGVRFSVSGARERPAVRAKTQARYADALGPGTELLFEIDRHGVKDSIHFETKPSREITRYQVDVSRVAGLRLVENQLEFLDAGGGPKLRVSAPFVVDAHGVRHEVSLRVEGCAYDPDARAPWGRPVVPPGAPSCDVVVSWESSNLTYPVTVDPAWTMTKGAMASIHGNHAAVVLPSRRVLVACGYFGSTVAEIYDPLTDTWARTGNTTKAHGSAVAVVLDGGDVFLSGGGGVETEIYRESRGTWVAGPPMAQARADFGMVKIPDGRVVVAGGTGVASAEIFDPSLSSWSPAGTMTETRGNPIFVLLRNGTALVAGGKNATDATSSAEIFTPPSTWTAISPMATARERHAATMLADGRVLVTGGHAGQARIATAEIYDPAEKAWASGGTFAVARNSHASVLLPSSRVLLAGGGSDDGMGLFSTELYEPVTGDWTTAGFTTEPRWAPTLTLLDSGIVLLAGSYWVDTELFHPLTLGVSCTNHGECASESCVEGICCDTHCSDPCTACTAAGKGSGADGVCGPIAAGTPDSDCPSLPASTCGATGTCDGHGACALYPAGTSCGPDVCAGGVFTQATCNGRGVCKKLQTNCEPYACASATACGAGPCASDAECGDGYYCSLQHVCAAVGCDGDHVVVHADRTRTDCAPYRCDADGCKARCRSSLDCAGTFVCNSDHACIPEELARRDDGRPWLCAFSTHGGRSGGFFALPFALMLFRRRRARVDREGLPDVPSCPTPAPYDSLGRPVYAVSRRSERRPRLS